MRKLLIAAGVAALAIPCAAVAQPCAVQQDNHATAGTVAGAGTGALVGAAVGGPVGAVVGALGGAAVGGSAGATAPTSCDYTRTGYYDGAGVWRPGYAYTAPAYTSGGYYDANGTWVPYGAPPAADYGSDVAYTGGGDLMARENALQARIDQGRDSGALADWQARRDEDVLASIRMQARRDYEAGAMGPDERADLVNRLDNLSATVHAQWGD